MAAGNGKRSVSDGKLFIQCGPGDTYLHYTMCQQAYWAPVGTKYRAEFRTISELAAFYMDFISWHFNCGTNHYEFRIHGPGRPGGGKPDPIRRQWGKIAYVNDDPTLEQTDDNGRGDDWHTYVFEYDTNSNTAYLAIIDDPLDPVHIFRDPGPSSTDADPDGFIRFGKKDRGNTARRWIDFTKVRTPPKMEH